mmetsp:Transcript_11399/g.36198  ORF Transcript_11399/g.36198 Transcript_11399/m.36198 type:complete len:390 (-) Transcript_11399:3568-4737(-)
MARVCDGLAIQVERRLGPKDVPRAHTQEFAYAHFLSARCRGSLPSCDVRFVANLGRGKRCCARSLHRALRSLLVCSDASLVRAIRALQDLGVVSRFLAVKVRPLPLLALRVRAEVHRGTADPGRSRRRLDRLANCPTWTGAALGGGPSLLHDELVVQCAVVAGDVGDDLRAFHCRHTVVVHALLHHVGGTDRAETARLAGPQRVFRACHVQGPGTLLAEDLVLCPAAAQHSRQGGGQLLVELPLHVGQDHLLHALRGRHRQPYHVRPRLRRQERPRQRALGGSAHAIAGHGGHVRAGGRRGRRRPAREATGGLPAQECLGDVVQDLLHADRQACSQQRRRSVALGRFGPRVGTADAAALQGALLPRLDGAHPALRRADHDSEERAVHEG